VHFQRKCLQWIGLAKRPAFAALRDLSRIPGGPSPRPRRRAWLAGALALVVLLGGAAWCGPPALRYLANMSAIEVSGDPGLTSVIVHRDGKAVTEAMLALLKELVTQRQEQRELVEIKVEAGRAGVDALNEVDARLNDAKARLAEAQSK
jgi:hypothetical protein